MESRSEYLQRRAEEEDSAADRAASDKARDLHMELASRYRDAAGNDLAHRQEETVSSTRPREFTIID